MWISYHSPSRVLFYRLNDVLISCLGTLGMKAYRFAPLLARGTLLNPAAMGMIPYLSSVGVNSSGKMGIDHWCAKPLLVSILLCCSQGCVLFLAVPTSFHLHDD